MTVTSHSTPSVWPRAITVRNWNCNATIYRLMTRPIRRTIHRNPTTRQMKMAKGNFKQAIGTNADIVAVTEVQGVIYVATTDTVYRLVFVGGKYTVEELLFDY
jgi:hypothetical protein